MSESMREGGGGGGGSRAVSPPTCRTSPTSNTSDRATPTGRRSPKSYYERTTTVRFVQPSTGRAVCTKLNRVQRTKVRIDNGTCLCENFLRGHCDFGSNCPLAHVPKQYLWDFLTPTVNRDTYTYDKGFNVRCYTPNMDAYYDIPSEWIYVTRGSERYVELYNDNGDNFKEKCKLCEDLQRTGCCQRGGECEDVHCCCADISQFPCIRTHIAEPEAVQRYERLGRGVTVRVFQPNSGVDSQDFAGDDVLRTAGATQYEEAYMREGGVPNVKMQHCAHFQNKKLCRLGDGCRFLHVVSIALATPLQDEDDSLTPRLSPVLMSRSPPPPLRPPPPSSSSSSSSQLPPHPVAPSAQTRASKNSAAYFAAASLAQRSRDGAGGTGASVADASSASIDNNNNNNNNGNSIMSSLGTSNCSAYDNVRQLPCVLNVATPAAAIVTPATAASASYTNQSLFARTAPSQMSMTYATAPMSAAAPAASSTLPARDAVNVDVSMRTAAAGNNRRAYADAYGSYQHYHSGGATIGSNMGSNSDNNNNNNNSCSGSSNARCGVGSVVVCARTSPNSTTLRVPMSESAVRAMAETIQLSETCAPETAKIGAMVSPRRNNPYALSPPR